MWTGNCGNVLIGAVGCLWGICGVWGECGLGGFSSVGIDGYNQIKIKQLLFLYYDLLPKSGHTWRNGPSCRRLIYHRRGVLLHSGTKTEFRSHKQNTNCNPRCPAIVHHCFFLCRSNMDMYFIICIYYSNTYSLLTLPATVATASARARQVRCTAKNKKIINS